MANKFGKGIPLTTGFDLGTTGPLDSRTVVDNLDDINNYNPDLLYPGLLVYVIEENQNYQYNGTAWQTLKVEGDMGTPEGDVDLSNYYTAPQVDAIVDTHANSMRDEISQTYALKKDVENFITEEEFNTKIEESENGIMQSVNATFQTKNEMGEYISKTEFESRLDQTADEITMEVTKEFATKNEIGNLVTEEELESKLQINADEIMSTVSKNYVTNENVNTMKQQIKDELSIEFEDGIDLTNFPTKLEMQSAINQKADNILSTVSSTYLTEDELGNTSVVANINSKIDQKANEITQSVAATYQTKDDMTGYITDAEVDTKIEASLEDLSLSVSGNYVTKNELGNYSTTEQMNSAIELSKTGILNTVSSTYTTKDDMKNYSTTSQMQSAIDQKASSITSSVSSTYATKNELGNYSTTEQMNSAIELSKTGILNTVSSTYTTKDDMKNYSTTSEMQSAIDQKASSITSTVSSTYATKNELTGEITEINKTMSQIDQQADKINWLVKSGDSESNMTLTDKAYSLITDNITLDADHINLHGYISANGNFKIDTNGNMIANNGTFTGDIAGSTFSSANDEFRVLEDGTVKSQSLVIEDLITTRTLNVEEINNPAYPSCMYEALTVIIDETAFDEQVSRTWCGNGVYRSFSEMLSYAPRNLNGYTLTINIGSDIHENISLSWFHSGQVNIEFNGHTVYGYVYCYGASMVYRLYGQFNGQSSDSDPGYVMPYKGKVSGSYTYGVYFQYCQFAINNISIYPDKVNDTNSGGIYANRGARGCVFQANAMGNMRYLVRADYGSHVYVSKTTGRCNNATFCASTGGIICLNSNESQAGTTGTNPYWAGAGGSILTNQVLGMDLVTFDNAVNEGTNNNPGTNTGEYVTVIETIKATSADTYRSTVYNNWKGDGTVRQGDCGYGDCQGMWFFNTNLKNAMARGDVVSITLFVTRQTGGSSSAQTATFKIHDYSHPPYGTTGAPKYGNTLLTTSLKMGENIIKLNSSQIAALKTHYGIGLSIGSTSSPYIVCSGNIKINVEYKTTLTNPS